MFTRVMVHPDVRIRVRWPWVRRRKSAVWAGWTPAPALGKLFGYGVLVQACPRLLGEGRCVTGAPGSRPSQRGHRDCLPVSLDGLLVLAGHVGMIMAVFVPISGYRSSKNPSGRPDLNRRPLDPSHLPGVAGCRPTGLTGRLTSLDIRSAWLAVA